MGGNAPGAPGIPLWWTSGAKIGVGTASNAVSRVWFTLGEGVVDEIYYPHPDVACTRDLVLVVTDGQDFFSDERRDTRPVVEYLVPGVPAYRLLNTDTRGRYRIEKEVITDPRRDVVLARVRLVPLVGALADYRVYALLAPHLGNEGADNTGWVGDYKGVPMLFAQRGAFALALACSAPWRARTVGYAGVSDGYQDLSRHRLLTWIHDRAERGNVTLTGEIDLRGGDGSFVLALGFGLDPTAGGQLARASLQDDFAEVLRMYVDEWATFQRGLLELHAEDTREDGLYGISTAVIGCHEGKQIGGAIIASLSIPWGNTADDHDLGGYHLVWIRDMVEAAGGLTAAGARDQAHRVLEYLQSTQEADGHWPQNMHLSGVPYWNGVQLDQTGVPILLADMGWREALVSEADMRELWPMVRRAASYIVRHGPATDQDRWEENAGYSPYTLAVEIAALLAAADLADRAGEAAMAIYLRETADAWNEGVERWTFATGTEIARHLGVSGYYVRIAPREQPASTPPWKGQLRLRNRRPGADTFPAAEIVSPDALALVRLGLRAPDDPRIRDTVRVIDALTRVETPFGPAWHRYNHDGYGEKEDGAPYDGTGVGRAWPLLTGERAHFELAAGRLDEAARLMRTLEAFSNEGGMLPEQIWDTTDLPARRLFLGRPTGSATPLVWAHAEYIKLRRSLRARRVFDMPPQTLRRYVRERTGSALWLWRAGQACEAMPAGKRLRIELPARARIRWSADEWRTAHDAETRDPGLGLHVADLDTAGAAAGATVRFTFYWLDAAQWEGRDHAVSVV